MEDGHLGPTISSQRLASSQFGLHDVHACSPSYPHVDMWQRFNEAIKNIAAIAEAM